MPGLSQYIVAGVLIVAILALASARLRLFQKDLRRAISFGVSCLGFITTLLSIHVLVTGFRLREAALAAGDMGQVSQWNGLALGAIVLLMVSALTFFFALGVFIWSLVPPAPPAPARASTVLGAWGGFEAAASKTFNPVDQR